MNEPIDDKFTLNVLPFTIDVLPLMTTGIL